MSALPLASNGMRIYRPDGKILREFMRDRAHVSIIRGPLGSGTSSACCQKIFRLACEQKPQADGKRRSRWIVCRNSYPMLRNTTIRTWLDWFPEEIYGKFYWSRPPVHEIRVGDVELDVVFQSASDESDISKFRSFEYTGVYFNELEYIPFIIFEEAESRTGRYPAKKDGGSTWRGVLSDMNAPDETHWLPRITEEVPIIDDGRDDLLIKPGLPVDWAYFVQPPALLEIRDATGRNVTGYRLNPEAENVSNLEDGYYEEKARGKSKQWIDSRLRNKITFVIDGDPVHRSFNPDVHIATETLMPVPGHDVYVGVDFGRNRPAACFAQMIDNRAFIQYEFRRYGMAAVEFAPQLKRFLEQTYPGYRYKMFGDPKGQDRGQADDRTSYDVFRANDLMINAAPVKANSPETRIMAVESLLNTSHHGLPRFIMSPSNCPTLKAAMCGRYHVRRDGLGEVEPVKDAYSDIADSLQYLVLGMGEGRAMVGLTPGESFKPRQLLNNRRAPGSRKV